MMGTTIEALNLLLALMNTAMTAMASAAQVSAIIKAAQAEGHSSKRRGQPARQGASRRPHHPDRRRNGDREGNR